MSSIWGYVALLGLGLGGAVYFLRQARVSGERKEREKQQGAVDEAAKDQDENDQDFERRRRNKPRRKRLLDAIRKARGSD